MKTNFVYQNSAEPRSYSTLGQLVDLLSTNLLPQTMEHRSCIVNDIKQEMFVNTDNNIIATVLNNLLNITITNSQNNSIHVSAKLFGNIILVHVKNNDKSLDQAITQSLKQIQPMAEKLGGCVAVTHNKLKGTTVAFTFNNNKMEAA